MKKSNLKSFVIYNSIFRIFFYASESVYKNISCKQSEMLAMRFDFYIFFFLLASTALLKMNGILTNEQIQSVWAGDKPQGSLSKNSKFKLLLIRLLLSLLIILYYVELPLPLAP